MGRIGILTGPKVIERNMEHVLYRVSDILSANHTVDLVGLNETSGRIEKRFNIFNENRRLKEVLPFPLSIVQRTLVLIRYVLNQGPDILMTLSSIGSNGFLVALIGRLTGLPTIVRVTSDIFKVQKYKRPMFDRAKLFFKNNLFGRATIFLAKRTLLLHEVQILPLVREGFDKKRFFVVPQPIGFSETENGLSANIDVIREAHSIPSDSYLVGWFGRVAQDKHLERLKGVISQVSKKDSNVYFMIIGDGPKKQWLVKELHQFPRLIFVGQLPRDSLSDYYQACDAILHTSYSEGLSSVIAEALYFSRPVIAEDSGPITRKLVSNIGKTTDELTEYILSRRAIIDELPIAVQDPKVNSKLYLSVINELLLMKNLKN